MNGIDQLEAMAKSGDGKIYLVAVIIVLVVIILVLWLVKQLGRLAGS